MQHSFFLHTMSNWSPSFSSTTFQNFQSAYLINFTKCQYFSTIIIYDQNEAI
jgi:hypothetical protein